MAEAKLENSRPNIRIEIHNNCADSEEMEVDTMVKSDNEEEGEIIEDNEVQESTVLLRKPTSEIPNKAWSNATGTFTTGINIFDKEEQEKLLERAKRFALRPDEIRNFTDADLEELYESLGICAENENNVRFEAVHMLGTNEMTTEDILEYFAKYAPTGIEWVNEHSCNVIWLETISAARAMFYVSKGVQGMPARGPCDPFAKEFLDEVEEDQEADGTGQSILLKNKNRQVELKIDDDIGLPAKVLKNAVDISEITVPIPPGYWRIGEKHAKARCLLLRFAFKTDKKPYKSEKFSKYHKMYGNSNFGGLKGIISESKKKELRGIFERNKDISQEKNPWGSLAKNWDHDAKFREREPEIIEEPQVEIKNPSILVRLGTKRKRNDSEDEQKHTDNEEEPDMPEDKETKKNKLPRMRMYADEEEEKLRRKKLLQTIKQQAEKLSNDGSSGLNRRDLRNILGITNKRGRGAAAAAKMMLKEEITAAESDSEVIDLGTKLKNRTKNMIFTVERDLEADMAVYDHKENVRSDIRSLIDERRASRSPPHYRKRTSPRRGLSPPQRQNRSFEYSRRSPMLRRRRRSPSPPSRRSLLLGKRGALHRRRSPEKTLHSDRMMNPRHRHRRHSNESDLGAHSQKPKSKVAVVIKTQKRPTVASTIWSRVQRPSESESSSESNSSMSEEGGSSSSSEDSESETGEDSSSSLKDVKRVARPGFREDHDSRRRKFTEKMDHRSPLKITMTNDRFRK